MPCLRLSLFKKGNVDRQEGVIILSKFKLTVTSKMYPSLTSGVTSINIYIFKLYNYQIMSEIPVVLRFLYLLLESKIKCNLLGREQGITVKQCKSLGENILRMTQNGWKIEAKLF